MTKPPTTTPLSKLTTAHPYRRPPKSPHPPLPTPSPLRHTTYFTISALFFTTVTAYTVIQYLSLTGPPSPSHTLPEQDADTSSVYDSTAAHFDRDVSWIEAVTGINRLRRQVVRKACQRGGHVLEVGVGTGRNAALYDLGGKRGGKGEGEDGDEERNGGVESITFLDQSAPMIAIAKRKWDALHPDYRNAEFRVQSAAEPIAPPACLNTTTTTTINTNNSTPTHDASSPAPNPETYLNKPPETPSFDGFTTILSTLTLCSLPSPTSTLTHLSNHLSPTHPHARIYLLEHGRSTYAVVNWVLDRAAARHAVRHGCWWNRDISAIVTASGLAIIEVRREAWQGGTVWVVECGRGKGRLRGEGELGRDGDL